MKITNHSKHLIAFSPPNETIMKIGILQYVMLHEPVRIS